MPRLLIGHGVYDGIAEFEIGRGRDGVKITDAEFGDDGFPAAFELEIDGARNRIVGHLLERLEFGHQLAVDAHQDVARLEGSVGRTAGQYFVDHEHAGERGE
jgi:hypothetical protein